VTQIRHLIDPGVFSLMHTIVNIGGLHHSADTSLLAKTMGLNERQRLALMLESDVNGVFGYVKAVKEVLVQALSCSVIGRLGDLQSPPNSQRMIPSEAINWQGRFEYQTGRQAKNANECDCGVFHARLGCRYCSPT
jgi:hypothetical protein